MSVPFATHREVGAPTAVDPDVPSTIAPSAAVDTIGVATLAQQAHVVAANACFAFVSTHIVGRTRDDFHSITGWLPIPAIAGVIAAIVVAAATAADLEVRAAAMVDPDAAVVVGPIASVLTGGIAALADQLHAAAGVDGADVAPAIVGRAIDVVAVVPAVEARAAAAGDLKVGTATAIHPDAAADDEAPRAVEDAGSIRALADQLNAAAYIGGAEVATHVVGRTSDKSRLRIWWRPSADDRSGTVATHTESEKHSEKGENTDLRQHFHGSTSVPV